MRKFIPFIVVILLLIGAVAFFVLHRSAGTFEKMEDAFAVPDQNRISKVILTDTEKKRVELTKVNGVWMVNGKFPARQELLVTLMEVITHMKTLCPVPRAAHDNVVRWIFERNIKVEVFTAKDEPAKVVYYVGGPTTDGTGTYMLREVDGKPDSRPYITYLPGLHGYLTPRYQTDAEIWRPKEIFKYTPDDIKSLSLEYPAEENKSFSLNRVAKDSFLLAAKDDKYSIHQTYQQKYILQYLAFYSSISMEAYDNKNVAKDSIEHTIPYCTFTITANDNSVNKVNLFYQPVNKRSKMPFDAKGKPMTYDADHFYAALNNNSDFAIVQFYVFGKLLRSYQDFFFKPGTAVVSR